MRVDEFDFDLPRDLIAQHPARPRDAARLLHVGASLGDHTIADLPNLLAPGDMLVCNDTRVIPSRLIGRRGESTVEVTLHKEVIDGGWWAFARPAKRLRIGRRLQRRTAPRMTPRDLRLGHKHRFVRIVRPVQRQLFRRRIRRLPFAVTPALPLAAAPTPPPDM